MDNKVIIVNGGAELEVSPNSIEGLNIVFQPQADNNIVKIWQPFSFVNVKIQIGGTNNSFILQNNASIKNSFFAMMGNSENKKIEIGKHFSFEGGHVFCHPESNNKLTIGDNCMFSHGITIRCEDGHTIFDMDTKEVINKGGEVKIGNNVWICSNVFIGKNVELANDIIVGACSVVTKSFDKSHIAIAGNPAKLVKENVGWSIANIKDYKPEKEPIL